MRYLLPGAAWGVALVMGLCWAACAQAAEATVKGTGTATLQKPADRLHLEVQLQVHGKDVQDATASLRQRESLIKEKLAGIAPCTVSFDPARVESDNDPRKAYAKMMTGMMNGAARKKATPAKGVNVSAMLRADWDLKGAGAEDISLAAYQLQEKVASAAPWTVKAKEGDAQQQEEEEVAEEAAGNPYLAAMQKPGQPVFSYAARFTAAERTKAAGEAFARATEQATQLAKAAGKSLGDLNHLEGQQLAPNPPENNSGAAEYLNLIQSMMSPGAKPRADRDVTFGDEPGQITEPVAVTAVFNLKG